VKKSGWILLAVSCMALAALAVGWPTAEAATSSSDPVLAAHSSMPQDHAFEGGRTACRRCHIKQYRSWEATPHAKALETLPEESQSDPACLQCHTTTPVSLTRRTSPMSPVRLVTARAPTTRIVTQ